MEQAVEKVEFRLYRYVAFVAFTIQFVIMGFRSWTQYDRFNLTADFATYYNAFTQISGGNWTPFNSQAGYPFLDNHFELYMWPLSVLGLITKSGLVLLFVQNLGTAGAGLVAFLWALDICREQKAQAPRKLLATAGAVVLVLMVASPWPYLGTGYDYHSEALGTFFVLLVARSFYNGQNVRGYVFVLCTLFCGDVSSTYLLPIGLSLLFYKRKKAALVCIASCVAWLGLSHFAGENHGSTLYRYFWLWGPNAKIPEGSGALLFVVLGIVLHPIKVIAAFWDRASGIFDKLSPSGFFGILSPLSLPLAAVIFMENTLTTDEFYWEPTFQDTALVIVAGAGLLTLAFKAGAVSNRLRLLVYPVLVALLLNGIWYDTHRDIPLTRYEQTASAGRALKIANSKIEATDQVIASYSVVGRFGNRSEYLIFDQVDRAYVVSAKRVVFVFDVAKDRQDFLIGSSIDNAIAYVRNDLKAKQLVDDSGIVAFAWSPPEGTTRVRLPK